MKNDKNNLQTIQTKHITHKKTHNKHIRNILPHNTTMHTHIPNNTPKTTSTIHIPTHTHPNTIQTKKFIRIIDEKK